MSHDPAAVRPDRLPLVARWYIAATSVGAVAVWWWVSQHEVVVRPLDTFIVLAIVGIVIDSQPLTFSYKGQLFSFSMGTPFTLAMLTVFGVLPAAVVQVVASLAGDLFQRKSWPKVVFNASQFVLSVAAAGAVLEGLLGRPIVYPGMSFGADQMPALLLALVTFFVVNSLCTAMIIQFVSGWEPRQVLARFVSRESWVEASALLLVPVVAVSTRQNPILGLFLTVPVVAISRATRLAMENVTLLEEHAIALEEKHAAKEAAQEREAAREAADRANKAKSEFLSQMSHELRTPLNAVFGFAQLLDMDPLTPEQKDSTAEIIKAGQHLLELINEVLDIASIEAGRLRLSLEPVDAVHAVAECMSLVAPLAERDGIELHFEERELADDAHLVTADRQRLKQVALNVISNAIKYNTQHGSVRISFERTDGGTRIDVADTGKGIPAEAMGRLFTPFERLGAEGSSIEGTGLGLALTKQLVEAMGGTISVTSEMGRGTTFSVELSRA